MPPDIKHPYLMRRVKNSQGEWISEPVMVNRHSRAEKWEFDPDWTLEQQAELEQQQAEQKVQEEKCRSKK